MVTLPPAPLSGCDCTLQPAAARRRASRRRAALPRSAVGWAGAALAMAGLAAAHRAVAATPWQEANALAPLDALYSLAVAALVLTLATALGRALLSRWAAIWVSSLERTAFAAALGLAVFGYAVFALALLHLLNAPVVLGLGMPLAVALRRECSLLVHDLVGVVRCVRAADGPWARPVLATGGMLAVFALLIACLPPFSYDALMYHLALPQTFIQAHQFVVVRDQSQAAFPLTVEMVYTLPLLVGGESGAALLHLAMAALAARALWSLCARLFDRRAAWLAVAAFITASDVNRWAAVANIDLALTLFELLAAYAVLLWLETRERAWLVLGGLLAGVALASKYSALGALAPLVLLLLAADGLTPRRVVLQAGHATVLVALALGVAAPWYLKNAVVYHNPLYPLLSPYQFDPLLATGAASPAPAPDLWSLALLPLHLATQGSFIALTGRGLGDYLQLPLQVFLRGDVETMGRPSFLAIAAPLALLWLRERTVRRLAFLAAFAALAWAVGVQELRYLLPAFPLFAALAGVGLARLSLRVEGTRVIRHVVPAFVLLVLVASLLENGIITLAQRPLGPLLGSESRAAFLDRAVPPVHYGALTYLAAHVAPGQRALGVGEQRPYYVRAPMLFDDAFAVAQHVFVDPGSPAATAAILQRAGVAYVLVSENDLAWYTRFQPAEAARLQAAFGAVRDRYLTPVYHEEGATVYRFTFRPAKAAP